MRDYVGELEHFVTQIRVPVLKIDVLSEQNFLGSKVLKNKFVEKSYIAMHYNAVGKRYFPF